jgi:hypothetical protein
MTRKSLTREENIYFKTKSEGREFFDKASKLKLTKKDTEVAYKVSTKESDNILVNEYIFKLKNIKFFQEVEMFEV